MPGNTGNIFNTAQELGGFRTKQTFVKDRNQLQPEITDRVLAADNILSQI